MTDSALHWLQEIETSLEAAVTKASRLYDAAPLKDRPRMYMLLAKLRERRTTINNALVDLLQARITIEPPSPQTVKRTKALTDDLQDWTNAVRQYDAMLKLLSDLSSLVSQTITEPSHD